MTTAILAAGLSTPVVGGWGGSGFPTGPERTSTTPASRQVGAAGLAHDAPGVEGTIPEDVDAAATLAAEASVMVWWPGPRCGPLRRITVGTPTFYEMSWLNLLVRNGPGSQ